MLNIEKVFHLYYKNNKDRIQNKVYEELVNSYIRQKYTESQEFAILRQKDEKPQEYKEYFDYCEECKAKAKKEVIK